MNTQDLSIMAILASLYVAVGVALPSISFGPVQSRLSDALYPLIAVFGLPGVVGLTLGHLIFNLYGYAVGVALGPLDVLVSVPLFIIPKLLIWRFGLKAVPIHVLFVALWVPYLLWSLFGLPYLLEVILVGGGEIVAEILVGLPLVWAVRRRLG